MSRLQVREVKECPLVIVTLKWLQEGYAYCLMGILGPVRVRICRRLIDDPAHNRASSSALPLSKHPACRDYNLVSWVLVFKHVEGQDDSSHAVHQSRSLTVCLHLIQASQFNAHACSIPLFIVKPSHEQVAASYRIALQVKNRLGECLRSAHGRRHRIKAT